MRRGWRLRRSGRTTACRIPIDTRSERLKLATTAFGCGACVLAHRPCHDCRTQVLPRATAHGRRKERRESQIVDGEPTEHVFSIRKAAFPPDPVLSAEPTLRLKRILNTMPNVPNHEFYRKAQCSVDAKFTASVCEFPETVMQPFSIMDIVADSPFAVPVANALQRVRSFSVDRWNNIGRNRGFLPAVTALVICDIRHSDTSIINAAGSPLLGPCGADTSPGFAAPHPRTVRSTQKSYDLRVPWGSVHTSLPVLRQ